MSDGSQDLLPSNSHAESDREERDAIESEEKRLALLRAEIESDDRHGDREERERDGGHHPTALDPRQSEITRGHDEGRTEPSDYRDSKREADLPGRISEDEETDGYCDVREWAAVDSARPIAPVGIEGDRAGSQGTRERPEEPERRRRRIGERETDDRKARQQHEREPSASHVISRSLSRIFREREGLTCIIEIHLGHLHTQRNEGSDGLYHKPICKAKPSLVRSSVDSSHR